MARRNSNTPPEESQDPAEVVRLLRQVRRLSRQAAHRQAEAHEELSLLRTAVAVLRTELDELRGEVATLQSRTLAGLQLAVDDEAAARTRLQAARAQPSYAAAWDDAEPLVSIVIPTYTNWELLSTRAVPSVLRQTYANLEVVVVGDTAPADTARSLVALDDPRVRYENLGIRGPYPEDDRLRWFVAGTGPMNRAMQLARGEWTAYLNDDDELRPDHVERLLEHAQVTRAEVSYGKMIVHYPDDRESFEFGQHPPVMGGFAWQIAIEHGALRDLYSYELGAAAFEEPGDWHRARRMLRTGVRFEQLDAVTCDYYPNHVWKHG